MQIDLSTQEVCEAVQRSSSPSSSLSLSHVLKLWHSVGTIIRSQMEQKKGVKLDHFGSFTFDIMGEPCFNCSVEFKRAYKVHQMETPSHDNSPVSKLNLTLLSRMTGLDRSVADKVYNKFITTVGGGIRLKKNVLLTVHKVAEIFINNDAVKVMFLPDFLDALGSQSRARAKGSGLKRPSSAPRATRVEGHVLDMSVISNHHPSARARASTPSGRARPSGTMSPALTKGKKPNPRGKKRVESAMNRSHNPILGDDEDAHYVPGKKRAEKTAFNARRNPILNKEEESVSEEQSFQESISTVSVSSRGSRTSSMLNSPPYASKIQRSQRPNELVKENLKRHDAILKRRHSGANADSVEDARKIAARAIGPGNIVEKIKEKIIARGGVNGIKGFTRLLAIMDDSGDRKLSKEELLYGLRDYGLSVTKTELEQLFLAFDRDGNGFIDVDEFLIGIRGDLNDRRKRLIRMAFDTLDTDGSGFVTVDEMNEKYDVSCNPEVQQGKITPEEAMQQFMKQWDRLDGDGMVSVEEFEDYYKGVSSSIDGDDYFELMIRNAWRIAGGTGACANTANKRVLVTNKDGTQRVVTVNNELGMKGGDVEAVRSRLAQQGIKGGEIELHGGVDTTEKSRKARSQRENDGGHNAAPKYERYKAAEKLSSAFRGHKARKEVEFKKRSEEKARQREAEYEEELNREKSKRIYRPKGKSYIGF